jgi:hypothetical protein
LQDDHQFACLTATGFDNIKHIVMPNDDRQWLIYGFNSHLFFASPYASVDELPSILFAFSHGSTERLY